MKKLIHFSCSCARAFFRIIEGSIVKCEHCGQKWNFENDIFYYMVRSLDLNGKNITITVYTIEGTLLDDKPSQKIINKAMLKPHIK